MSIASLVTKLPMSLNKLNTPKKSSTLTNSLLMLLLVIAVPLLFTTELKLYQHRLMSFVWNSGHILLFFTAVWLGLNLARRSAKPRFWALFVGVNLLVFGLSVGIEEIQSAQGRENSIEDIYKNCLGASLALLLHPKTRVAGDRIIAVMRGALFLLLAFALLPLAINTIDSLYSRASFPVLASFESPFETERWKSDNLAVIKSETGGQLLQNKFQPGRYSTLSFFYFPADWTAYDCLSIRINSSSSDRFSLMIRINDRQHNLNERRYADRFNYKTALLSGWNQLRIPLANIKQAPRGRDMNMEQIEEITFYSVGLRRPVTLLFDDIELKNLASDCVPDPGATD